MENLPIATESVLIGVRVVDHQDKIGGEGVHFSQKSVMHLSRMETARLDDIGGRKDQQDRVQVVQGGSGGAQLLVLADGVGGHEGGVLAALPVIDAAAGAFQTLGGALVDDPASQLASIVASVHQRINALGAELGVGKSTHRTIARYERFRDRSARQCSDAIAGAPGFCAYC